MKKLSPPLRALAYVVVTRSTILTAKKLQTGKTEALFDLIGHGLEKIPRHERKLRGRRESKHPTPDRDNIFSTA
jgi:hypothetical protein